MSTRTDSWTELRSAALVGTQRRPLEGRDERLAMLDDDLDAEHRALATAALLGAARRVATPAGTATPATAAPPTDVTGPGEIVAPERAVQILELLLGGTVPHPNPLIERWLTRCAETGHVVPNHLLVDLLNIASRRREFRAAAIGSLPRRGSWLAALRDDWRWAAAAHADPSPDRSPDLDPAQAQPDAGSDAAKAFLNQVALDAGAKAPNPTALWPYLVQVPGTWSPTFAAQVLDWVAAEVAAARLVPSPLTELADRFPTESLGDLERHLATAQAANHQQLARVLRPIVHQLPLRTAITEAFR